MKKIFIIVISLVMLFIMTGLSYSQTQITRFTMTVDSVIKKDTSNAVSNREPIKLAAFVEVDTVYKNGGDIPSFFLQIQYGDSTGLWSVPYDYAAADTIIDTIAVNRRYNISLTSLWVPSVYRRYIATTTGNNNKDTLVIHVADVAIRDQR